VLLKAGRNVFTDARNGVQVILMILASKWRFTLTDMTPGSSSSARNEAFLK
jgi:hypothetical protein